MSFCGISKKQNFINKIKLVGLQKHFRVLEQVTKYLSKNERISVIVGKSDMVFPYPLSLQDRKLRPKELTRFVYTHAEAVVKSDPELISPISWPITLNSALYL